MTFPTTLNYAKSILRLAYFHGLLRTVGFADYQITIPVTLEFSQKLTGICPVTVHNEIQEIQKKKEKRQLWAVFGSSPSPSFLEVLRFLPSSLNPPFHPYALGLSTYPDGPFSALGPRSLLLPLSPVPQTHSLLFPLLSSSLFSFALFFLSSLLSLI